MTAVFLRRLHERRVCFRFGQTPGQVGRLERSSERLPRHLIAALHPMILLSMILPIIEKNDTPIIDRRYRDVLPKKLQSLQSAFQKQCFCEILRNRIDEPSSIAFDAEANEILRIWA